MISFESIITLVIYAVLGIIVYKNKDKMEVVDKIFLVYKWDKGVDFIKKFANFKPLWKLLSTLSIPVCLFLIFYSVDLLFMNAVSIFQAPEPTPGVGVLLPGAKMPGTGLKLSALVWIISIIILALVHELSHGIIAIVEGIDLKTTGVGLLAILPVAFVEPDRKSFQKAGVLSRIRMLCAGSSANLITGLLAALILVTILLPLQNSQVNYLGVNFTSVASNGPAGLAGIKNNTIIIGAGDETITTMIEFENVLNKHEPNDTMKLVSEGNESYYVNLTSKEDNESAPYLGVNASQEWEYKKSYEGVKFSMGFLSFLINLLLWVNYTNLAVGIFNLYPLWITDGGKVLIDLMSTIIKDEKILAFIINLIFFTCLGILLFNIFGPYFV